MGRTPGLAIVLTGVLSGMSLAQVPSPKTATAQTVQPANSPAAVVSPSGQAERGPEPGAEAGVPAESRPGQQAAELGGPVNKLGPTPVQDVQLLQGFLRQLGHAPEAYDRAMGKPQEPC